MIYDSGVTAIIAPPPTPNGDLHLGHLAGPYLGADILRRYVKLCHGKVVTALGVDFHQTYVVTSAERQGITAVELAEKSFLDVTATLAAAEIEFDIVGMPDDAYQTYVRRWFERLHESGSLERRTTRMQYDTELNRFLFEAYAAGFCRICLAPTRGNICEACGHPNAAIDLYGVHTVVDGGVAKLEERSFDGWVLDLERWKPSIKRVLDGLPELRPGLCRLADQLLAAPLPLFPITFPSSWGIPAPFPNSPGQVLNVWAEMLPGHYYWLSQAIAKQTDLESNGIDAITKYVQFLGFDNSFFYAFAHVGLACAAKEAGLEALLPSAIVTNEFYELEGSKFSTSQKHAIWGRDFLQDVRSDEARFYFCWSNPEVQRSNFRLAECIQIIKEEYRDPFNDLVGRIETCPVGDESAAAIQGPAASLLAAFATFYAHPSPSLRSAARLLSNALKFTATMPNVQPFAAEFRAVAKAIAVCAAPIVPNDARRLWHAIGCRDEMTWPAT